MLKGFLFKSFYRNDPFNSSHWGLPRNVHQSFKQKTGYNIKSTYIFQMIVLEMFVLALSVLWEKEIPTLGQFFLSQNEHLGNFSSLL